MTNIKKNFFANAASRQLSEFEEKKMKELGENVKDRDEIISAAKRFKNSPFSSYILSLDKDNFPKDMPKQACEAMWEIVKDEFDY